MAKLKRLFFLFIFLLSISAALAVTGEDQILKRNANQQLTDATFRGMRIIVGQTDIYLLNVSLNKTSTAGTVRIYNYTTTGKTRLGNCTTSLASAPKVVFSCPNIPLKARKSYYIIPEPVDATSAIKQYYNQSGSAQTPFNASRLIYQRATYYAAPNWNLDVGNDVFLWGFMEVGVTTTLTPAPAAIPYLKIKSNVNKFNATVNGTLYFTTNGTINTPYNTSDKYVFNISARAFNYIPMTHYNYNISAGNKTFTFTQIRINNRTYSNYLTKSGVNYTRTLTYAFNYTCWDGLAGTKAELLINHVRNASLSLTCTNKSNKYTGTFKRSTEGNFNISYYYNVSLGNRTTTGIRRFRTDLYAPVVQNLSIRVAQNFVLPNATLKVNCTDTISPTTVTTLKWNGGLFYNKSTNEGIEVTNRTLSLLNGVNNLTGACNDGFNYTTSSITRTLLLRTLYLIDEQDNTAFNLPNASSLIAYIDDNQTSYNFKTKNRANITFVADSEVKLRFEIIYSDGTIILRYVDIGLTDDDIRVCVNKQGITHYEQILTSSTERPVVLNSVFADCLVAADYTRFAYQNAKILKAYTYNNLYYLYTFENNDPTQDQVFLAAVDGSIATYINLDSLEFLEQGYNINTGGDAIQMKKRNENETEIYYYNVLQNNEGLRIAITNADTDETYFNSTAFADPDEAQIIFNIATLDANSTTLFKIYATKTIDGEDETIIKYFSINGVTGSQNSALMAIISIFILVFGLSFTIAARTFAWFGIIIVVINLALLSFATAAWYITFLMAVNVIILVYIFLVMNAKNSVEIG